MTHKAIKLGSISSHQILTAMNTWHGLNTSPRRILKIYNVAVPEKAFVSFLWERAVYALVNTEFAKSNERLLASAIILEIFEDPSATALVEVKVPSSLDL
ncbi:hypothetical protein Bca52824_004050 [Brassica carinata]|uniref:Uncharacterized protein n=1 Tax=Brassica carinata TaxID=52824 RepID=A0A8X7WPC0_BRACI|nr:hypothetical protein Bca52824_004050 [Brassica carinata]